MFGLSLTPWLLGGTAIAFVLATGAAGIYGHSKGYNSAANEYQLKIDKLQIDARDQVQKVRDAMTAQANEAVNSLETQNAKARIVYRTVTEMVDRIVDRPVYRNTCFDDDGLRLVNAALAGVAVATPALPSSNTGMPRVITTQ